MMPMGLQPCPGPRRRPSWPHPVSVVSITALQNMSGSPPRVLTPSPLAISVNRGASAMCSASGAPRRTAYAAKAFLVSGRLAASIGQGAKQRKRPPGNGERAANILGRGLRGPACGIGALRLSWSAFPQALKRVRVGSAIARRAARGKRRSGPYSPPLGVTSSRSITPTKAGKFTASAPAIMKVRPGPNAPRVRSPAVLLTKVATVDHTSPPDGVASKARFWQNAAAIGVSEHGRAGGNVSERSIRGGPS